jgi:hypothetical protein
MPTINITFTPGEVVGAAIQHSRELSEKILKLADLNVSPLAPGEDANGRRHKLASLGKQLAETFIKLDDFMRASVEELQRAADVTADAPESTTTIDPKDAN